jgi:hypothetical protein
MPKVFHTIKKITTRIHGVPKNIISKFPIPNTRCLVKFKCDKEMHFGLWSFITTLLQAKLPFKIERVKRKSLQKKQRKKKEKKKVI